MFLYRAHQLKSKFDYYASSVLQHKLSVKIQKKKHFNVQKGKQEMRTNG